MTERWLAIQGYEGRYAVSNLGNVMSMDFCRTGLPGILKPNMGRGYFGVLLYDAEGNAKRFTIHSLVAASFIGPRPHGMQINHKNGVKTDNNSENLEYCTQSQNMKHAHATGLQSNVGERHSRSKLTNADVISIRQRVKNGETQTAIAKEYGMDQSAISNVVRGRNWSHIPFEGEVRVVQ